MMSNRTHGIISIIGIIISISVIACLFLATPEYILYINVVGFLNVLMLVGAFLYRYHHVRKNMIKALEDNSGHN